MVTSYHLWNVFKIRKDTIQHYTPADDREVLDALQRNGQMFTISELAKMFAYLPVERTYRSRNVYQPAIAKLKELRAEDAARRQHLATLTHAVERLRKLCRLARKADVRCSDARGRFGDDGCGKCAGCQLRKAATAELSK